MCMPCGFRAEVLLSAGVGLCLVINSLGNTHTRVELGSANASAWSAFVRGGAPNLLTVDGSGEDSFSGGQGFF